MASHDKGEYEDVEAEVEEQDDESAKDDVVVCIIVIIIILIIIITKINLYYIHLSPSIHHPHYHLSSSSSLSS